MKKPVLLLLAAFASLAPLASCEPEELHDAWAIGVDVDQGPQNNVVLSSAMKLLSNAVPEALDGIVDGGFKGATSVTLGAAENAVGLPTAESSWRFSNFTTTQYDEIYQKVVDGDVVVPSNYDSPDELSAFLVANGYDQKEADSLADAMVPSSSTSSAYRPRVSTLAEGDDAEKDLPTLTADNIKITMITDVGTIDDKSFNQGTWEAVELWAGERGLSDTQYNYLRPASGTTDAYEDTIKQAIDNGANVIVSPGYLFSDSFKDLAPQYSNVYFIGIDFTQPNIAECPNVYNINFKEQEAGFFAGYAAAMEGFKSVGFMGGQAIPAPVKYGIGFLAGIAYANSTEGTDCEITASHIWYCGTFTSTPTTITPRIQGWYNSGVECVFHAAGQAGNDVFTACENYLRG